MPNINESKHGNLALFRSVRFLTRPVEKGGKVPFVSNKEQQDGSALALLAHLCGRCDIKQAYKLTIRQKVLAEDNCLSDRTIRSGLAQLEELGYIRRKERMGRADVIWINATAIFSHRAAVEAGRNEDADEDLAFPLPQEERPEDNTDVLDLPTRPAEKKMQQEVIIPTAKKTLDLLKETQPPGDTHPNPNASSKRLSSGLTERVLPFNDPSLAFLVKLLYEEQDIKDDDALEIARKALAKADGDFGLVKCALSLLNPAKLNPARCNNVVAVVMSQVDGVMDAARQKLQLEQEQERMDSAPPPASRPHLVSSPPAAQPVMDAASRLAGQVGDAQKGFAPSLRDELTARLALWFREIAFPELGEERVRNAVTSALLDPEKCRAFRDWWKRDYFLKGVQRLIDAHEMPPAATTATGFSRPFANNWGRGAAPAEVHHWIPSPLDSTKNDV